MSNEAKSKIIKACGISIDIAAPLIATFSQFPIWIEKSASATVSGDFVLMAFFSCIPLMKHIKNFIKSPSIPIVWLIVFVMLYALNSIIDQMIVVAFVGVISNTIGTFIYKIGDTIEGKDKNTP